MGSGKTSISVGESQLYSGFSYIRSRKKHFSGGGGGGGILVADNHSRFSGGGGLKGGNGYMTAPYDITIIKMWLYISFIKQGSVFKA